MDEGVREEKKREREEGERWMRYYVKESKKTGRGEKR